jgi:hypothetical protein
MAGRFIRPKDAAPFDLSQPRYERWMALDRSESAYFPGFQRSFFINLQGLYWELPGQPGYGDKRAS